jgi:hypothetical protein
MTALLIATPAVGELQPYRHYDHWNVARNTNDCALYGEFDNNSSLMITYDDRTNEVAVAFSDPSVKALKGGESRKLNTYFANRGVSGSLDEGWGEKDFKTFEVDGRIHFTRKMSAEFLVDVARYDMLAFFYGDVLLKSFSLKGSGQAVAGLRACAAEQSRKNPTDPFAGEEDTKPSLPRA